MRALPSPPVEGETSLWTLIDDVEEACAALRGTPADQTPVGVQNAIGLARNWIENARLGMTTAYNGLGALSRLLATLPGRKHVVFYSGGYAMDPSAVAVNVLEDCVSVYTVDARGLGSDGLPSQARAPRRLLSGRACARATAAATSG